MARTALLLLLALLQASCAADSPAPAPGEIRGAVLPEPLARPTFTLPDAAGEPYVFAERTAGKLTFLFFGYTYCPDVCPVHMASLAAALRDLPFADRERVEVVFVTVDPERDTPERLRAWLGAFDPRFVALRGSLESVNAVAAGLLLPPAVRDSTGGDGYTVGHSATVLAFSPEGPARVVYPFGTRREDWVHDLPILLGHDAAGRDRPRAGAGATRVAPAPGISVMRALVTRAHMADAAALYALIENQTDQADALIAVDAPAGRSELHETVREGEGATLRMQMRPVAQLELPAGATLRLAPGGYHVMLLQPALEWHPGDTVTVRFRFASGTVRTVQAPVVEHAAVEQLLDNGAR